MTKKFKTIDNLDELENFGLIQNADSEDVFDSGRVILAGNIEEEVFGQTMEETTRRARERTGEKTERERLESAFIGPERIDREIEKAEEAKGKEAEDLSGDEAVRPGQVPEQPRTERKREERSVRPRAEKEEGQVEAKRIPGGRKRRVTSPQQAEEMLAGPGRIKEDRRRRSMKGLQKQLEQVIEGEGKKRKMKYEGEKLEKEVFGGKAIGETTEDIKKKSEEKTKELAEAEEYAKRKQEALDKKQEAYKAEEYAKRKQEALDRKLKQRMGDVIEKKKVEKAEKELAEAADKEGYIMPPAEKTKIENLDLTEKDLEEKAKQTETRPDATERAPKPEIKIEDYKTTTEEIETMEDAGLLGEKKKKKKKKKKKRKKQKSWI